MLFAEESTEKLEIPMSIPSIKPSAVTDTIRVLAQPVAEAGGDG